MLVPLYAFLKGDTMGIVVLVQDTDTIDHLASVVQEAASMRVAPADARHVVYAGGYPLDPRATVAGAGLSALDRVDVAPVPAPSAAPSSRVTR